jgi:hypothetical protein
MDGGRPGGGGGRGGRLRTAALVGGRCAVRFLGSDSLRACAVGRLRASSGSEAAGPEAAASWAACVSLAARRSPRSSLPASRLSPAARSSGRLAAARRSRRRCRLARTRPEKPVRDPGGGGRLGCSGLSRRPPVAPGSPQPTSPSRRSSCPCSAQDVAPSRPSAICGRRTPESVLRAAAAARPTARRFQSIPRDPHAMEAGTARLRALPHSILRTRVLFDCAAAWTRLGVRVTRGRRPRRRRRGWLACAAGGGGNFD